MKYKVWLANLNELSSVKKIKLLDKYNNEEEIFHAALHNKIQEDFMRPKDLLYLEAKAKDESLEKEYAVFMESRTSVVTYTQHAYPKRLRHIQNPPYALFYIGELPDESIKTVGIVGARGRSAYGCEVTRSLSMELAKHGVNIISGMAKGIDADAHQGALDGNGKTYAVLGCGVDICYPRTNQYIYEQLIEKGGVIAEYPLKTKPVTIQFPLRNRIIAGLSDCIVVMEAREKSGSLITADYAMEQGKDVFVLPGRITDLLSKGTNRLLSQGAGPIVSIEEFLQELNLVSTNHMVQLDFHKNLLEKDELLVYSLLDFRPIGIGALLENSSFSLNYLIEIIENLMNKGYIREITPNYFVKMI